MADLSPILGLAPSRVENAPLTARLSQLFSQFR